MRRSLIVSPLHFVWATKGRQPLIDETLERPLYRCLVGEAEKLGVPVLAIGGMPDHVHLVVRFTALHSYSEFMKRLKGVSSAFANDLSGHQRLFRWQENYALFGFSKPQTPVVVAYVLNQKEHHANNTIKERWEQVDEEASDPIGNRNL